jgi:hypothetical protein
LYGQLESAGIEFDFSVGFNSRIGFRAGCARAYRAFDLSCGRPSSVVSVPLLWMDSATWGQPDAIVLSRIRTHLEEVKAVDGCVSLVVHPERFLYDERFFSLFQSIVAVCEELGADLSGRLTPPPDFEAVDARRES